MKVFERFTDRARKVMALANQEAKRFNHGYIETEHVLLGLVKEGDGVGATVLKNLEVDIKKLRLILQRFGPRNSIIKMMADDICVCRDPLVSTLYRRGRYVPGKRRKAHKDR
ncbi:unnamed protein product [marine sediment metagenome]|uniref:Clp R domain-containing protein n=1 Tax=marine sediment metagenome TaxID=412755 RepID=X1PA16_9ZZZZ